MPDNFYADIDGNEDELKQLYGKKKTKVVIQWLISHHDKIKIIKAEHSKLIYEVKGKQIDNFLTNLNVQFKKGHRKDAHPYHIEV